MQSFACMHFRERNLNTGCMYNNEGGTKKHAGSHPEGICFQKIYGLGSNLLYKLYNIYIICIVDIINLFLQLKTSLSLRSVGSLPVS